MSVAHSFRRSAAALLIAGLSSTPAMANDWLKAKQPHLQVTTEKSVASDAVTAAPEAGSSEAWQRAKHPALFKTAAAADPTPAADVPKAGSIEAWKQAKFPALSVTDTKAVDAAPAVGELDDVGPEERQIHHHEEPAQPTGHLPINFHRQDNQSIRKD